MADLTKSEVIRYAAHLFNLKPADILSDKRAASIHRARVALYMGFWKRMAAAGRQPRYSAIGRIMCRDHSTIIHGIAKARYMLTRDADFREAVQKIVKATTDDLPPFIPQPKQQTPCNLELQALEALHQQRERPMDDPEYTEESINTALKRSGVKSIRVYWDGEIVTPDEPARFDVYVKDDETGVYIADHGHDFEVTRLCDDRRHRPIGSARTYIQLIKVLEDNLLTVEKEAA